MDAALASEVRERAGHAGEYCRMPEASYPTVPFPIDHIIARQHGGLTIPENLALSCLHDNTHKGPNIAGIDPLTARCVHLHDSHPSSTRTGQSSWGTRNLSSTLPNFEFSDPK